MDITSLPSTPEEIAACAASLSREDIGALAPLLGEKNDKLRYPAFLILQKRSQQHPDVYPLWEYFAQKLDDPNSYQRNIAIILLAANVRWDKEKRFASLFPQWMDHCLDEKFVTCRQTLQSIPIWLPFAPEHQEEVLQRLFTIPVDSFRESQQKLILIDILHAMLALRKVAEAPAADRYFMDALTGGLLDPKSARELEADFLQ